MYRDKSDSDGPKPRPACDLFLLYLRYQFPTLCSLLNLQIDGFSENPMHLCRTT